MGDCAALESRTQPLHDPVGRSNPGSAATVNGCSTGTAFTQNRGYYPCFIRSACATYIPEFSGRFTTPQKRQGNGVCRVDPAVLLDPLRDGLQVGDRCRRPFD